MLQSAQLARRTESLFKLLRKKRKQQRLADSLSDTPQEVVEETEPQKKRKISTIARVTPQQRRKVETQEEKEVPTEKLAPPPAKRRKIDKETHVNSPEPLSPKAEATPSGVLFSNTGRPLRQASRRTVKSASYHILIL